LYLFEQFNELLVILICQLVLIYTSPPRRRNIWGIAVKERLWCVIHFEDPLFAMVDMNSGCNAKKF